MSYKKSLVFSAKYSIMCWPEIVFYGNTAYNCNARSHITRYFTLSFNGSLSTLKRIALHIHINNNIFCKVVPLLHLY